MARGRPPVPKAINDLKGDPGKRRRYQKEVKAPAGWPACPDYLDDVARAEWQDTCKQLEAMQLLSTADKTALELYCVAYSRYRTAQAKVADEGAVIPVGANGYMQKSPWATEMDQQAQLMKGYLLEFGMTAAARSRLRQPMTKDEKKKSKAKAKSVSDIIGMTA